MNLPDKIIFFYYLLDKITKMNFIDTDDNKGLLIKGNKFMYSYMCENKRGLVHLIFVPSSSSYNIIVNDFK